ncbi:hypothetical protein ACW6QP_14355 [Salegentibacter sp. HM20]
MSTQEILKCIEELPLGEKIRVIEETLRSIRLAETSKGLNLASEELFDEYSQNKELTAFTKLDFEEFYEAK